MRFLFPISDQSVLDECVLSKDEKDLLLSNIQHRLTPQPVKIRSDIEVSCYAYEGIDAVKTALKAGLEKSTEEEPIKVSLLTVTCTFRLWSPCSVPLRNLSHPSLYLHCSPTTLPPYPLQIRHIWLSQLHSS